MKEMNWTREEVVKRLAILMQSAETSMKDTAIAAVETMDDDMALEMFHEARRHRVVAVSIFTAADVLGIKLEEMRELEVDEEEANQFMKEISESKKEEIKEAVKGRVKVVNADEMPEELKEILKSILD